MPAPAGSAARGLTAAELAPALVELRALEGAAVVDAVALFAMIPPLLYLWRKDAA